MNAFPPMLEANSQDDLWFLAAAFLVLTMAGISLGLGALAEYWWKRHNKSSLASKLQDPPRGPR